MFMCCITVAMSLLLSSLSSCPKGLTLLKSSCLQTSRGQYISFPLAPHPAISYSDAVFGGKTLARSRDSASRGPGRAWCVAHGNAGLPVATRGTE